MLLVAESAPDKADTFAGFCGLRQALAARAALTSSPPIAAAPTPRAFLLLLLTGAPALATAAIVRIRHA